MVHVKHARAMNSPTEMVRKITDQEENHNQLMHEKSKEGGRLRADKMPLAKDQ